MAVHIIAVYYICGLEFPGCAVVVLSLDTQNHNFFFVLPIYWTERSRRLFRERNDGINQNTPTLPIHVDNTTASYRPSLPSTATGRR